MYITPCISICKLENGICIGCKRTKEEIAGWKKYSDEERLDIMRKLGYGNKRTNRRNKA